MADGGPGRVIARGRARALALAARRLLPVFAVVVPVLILVALQGAAGGLFGYDYQAYAHAADRLLSGQPLYDPAVDVAGGFAIYLYPPPFSIAVVPFRLLPGDAGMWLWIVLLVAAFAGGCALLPVRSTVRWLVLLVGGSSFPFVYGVKLGQVGPILFLLAVVGWRWMDRPVALGLSIAAGTVTKLQPALLFGWALVAGRWRAVVVGLIACLVAALGASVVAGFGTWADYAALLARVSQPVTTPRNVTPGAVAYGLGADDGLATVVQLAAMAATLAVTVLGWFRSRPESSYAATVVAAQLLSPLLWEHYAILVLVPVALLLERRHWWAIALPLAAWIPAPVVFPLTLAIAVVAPLATDGAGTGRPADAAVLVGEAPG